MYNIAQLKNILSSVKFCFIYNIFLNITCANSGKKSYFFCLVLSNLSIIVIYINPYFYLSRYWFEKSERNTLLLINIKNWRIILPPINIINIWCVLLLDSDKTGSSSTFPLLCALSHFRGITKLLCKFLNLFFDYL